MSNYEEQKKYFALSYRTGTDTWTHIPFTLKGSSLTKRIPTGSMILDLGSGRGLWAFQLGESGYKVIGVDYVKDIVDKQNEEVKNRHLEGKVVFVEGDALDIPFQDASYDAVTDWGLMQHLARADWDAYKKEILRVLKPGGYFLMIVFSKETTAFRHLYPKTSPENDFDIEGVIHHFFTDDEIKNTFENEFEIVESEVEFVPADAHIAYLNVLLKKK